jgi:uncharacterized LabA/DUF88 family protein
MYHSAKQVYQGKVNYAEILKKAVAGRLLVRAIAYAVRSGAGEETGFFDNLTKLGYEVRLKDLQVFVGGAKKGDWDVGIAMDLIRMAPKLDTIVLVSGDGDFTELVKYVKSQGCRVEVMTFKKTGSNMLIQEADEFISLDNKEYIFKRKA